MEKDDKEDKIMILTVVSIVDDPDNHFLTLRQGLAAPMILVKNQLTKIILADSLANSPTHGDTTDKEQKFEALSKSLFHIASAASGYASSPANLDNSLKAKVNFSLGKIINLPYNEMESFSLGLITVITPIISALADYGALPADLTAASAARTAYLAVQTKPQVDKAERKVQNSNIHPFIVEAKKILTEQCDPIASTLLRDHPDTYKLWFDARDVKDLPHGTTVVEGYAYKSDGVTGLYNVNIIFREQNIQTKTFLDGYYRVTHFPHGVANPVATIGEVSQRSDPFEVKMGHTVHHDFILPI